MEKTYKRVPFDIELAKKIQSGEMEGKILNNLKNEVRIVCFDRKDAVAPIIALFKVDGGEGVMYVRSDGHAVNCRDILVLEVPDNEPQFKPFDKVLVRIKPEYTDNNAESDYWCPAIFQNYSNTNAFKDMPYHAGGCYWNECIPYAGNEHLVGTTDKSEEE